MLRNAHKGEAREVKAHTLAGAAYSKHRRQRWGRLWLHGPMLALGPTVTLISQYASGKL